MQLVIGVVLEVQLGDIISADLGPAILCHMVHYRGMCGDVRGRVAQTQSRIVHAERGDACMCVCMEASSG